MNDTTGTSSGGLSGSFKKGSSTAIPYGHPHAKTIIEESREIMAQSETGQALLRVWDKFNIPIHVIKGTGETGFSPDLNTIYIQTSGAVKGTNPEIVMGFIKALREADLEYSGEKAPDPVKDIMAYAGFMHARNVDCIINICKFVQELTNSSYFSDLLDTLPKLGLNEVYKAYIAGASDEELYMVYAEAYDSTMRGS